MSGACFHCGLPASAEFRGVIGGQARQFCCPACLAVAEAISGDGLGSYYQQREGLGTRPEAPDSYAAFDDPAFQQQFVRRRDDGLCETTLLIGGMHCAACGWLLENHVGNLAGVSLMAVNQSSQQALVRWNPQTVKLSALCAAIARIGYLPQPLSGESLDRLRHAEGRNLLKRMGFAGLAMMQVGMIGIAMYIAGDSMDNAHRQLFRWVSLAVAIPVVLYAAQPFFQGAWRGLRTRQPGMDLPVATAIGLAFVASAWHTVQGAGEVYFDSIAMFSFFLLSARYLEHRARDYPGRLSDQLLSLLPVSSLRRDADGHWQPVPTTQLQVGDRVLIRPGQVVPADGVIESGQSGLAEAALTGEFTPRDCGPGDSAMAGSVNAGSNLVLAVTAVGRDLRLQQLQGLLDRALHDKPRVAEFTGRLARVFVIAVLILSALSYLLWHWLEPARALDIALAVLVVSCPCALGLAVPSAIAAATAALRRQGLLVCRADSWQVLAGVTRVLFDKTGTLTRGEPAIVAQVDIAPRHLAIAAALERASEHPLAKAFRDIGDLPPVCSHRVVGSQGVEGEIHGELWRIGTPAFAGALLDGAPDKPDGHQHWLLLAGAGGEHGWIAVDDLLRDDAAATVEALQAEGLPCELLSGDSSGAAGRLAKTLGMDACREGASPADKLDHLQALRARGECLLMVGDGLNDAPVLAAADVSVAAGEASALTRSSADAILLSGRLATLPAWLQLAARTRRVIRQNLALSLCYNTLAIPLAMAGWVPPWAAAIGMSASSLVVIGNAIRLRRAPPS
ncbi:MAG TPA: heavy metal translocating P-type ATPase, partial [Spongiibacteraceae bacterium]|nr:heavy metal translocating P-type ATPase [Spongiibacteraceae bacterium]